MTVLECFEKLRAELQPIVENPRLEAERLLQHFLKIPDHSFLAMDHIEVDDSKLTLLQAAVARRTRGEPLAYIVEHQGFFKYEFVVRPGVLVPRSETEMIVGLALELYPSPPSVIADLGCGSGCIGLSLLKEWPEARLLAIDSAPAAIAITEENALLLGVHERVVLVHSSVEKLDFNAPVDLIVANPPYIDRGDERVEEHVRSYEPAQALFADQDGLAAIFVWASHAKSFLRQGGWFIVEIGTGQSLAVVAKLNQLGYQNVRVIDDLAGHDRTIIAQR